MLDFPDPLVARYLEPEKLLEPARRLLSDQALYLDYCVRLELNWLRVLARHGRFAESLVDEAQERCADIDIQEIAEEEARVHHDLKAVVNVMTRYCPEELRPYVHLGATSYDILSNAHLLRLRDGCREIALPALEAVARELIRLARQESETHQVGRTHGQHAEPVTFGHAMAVYLDRMGFCIQSLKRSLTELRGKFSGAVGAYNTLGLLFEDPRAVEREVLALAGLTPARNSTQITHPEPALAVFHHLTAAFGVLANLADDLRHLQRTELAEVAEAYREGSQVGSSAMPHKRNPITWENVKSLWKVFMLQLGLGSLPPSPGAGAFGCRPALGPRAFGPLRRPPADAAQPGTDRPDHLGTRPDSVQLVGNRRRPRADAPAQFAGPEGALAVAALAGARATRASEPGPAPGSGRSSPAHPACRSGRSRGRRLLGEGSWVLKRIQSLAHS
ncbi:hypothetical protein DYH09_14620 [bacterium CPR1]|nr:hypothetical protein [bacterium CPR1]